MQIKKKKATEKTLEKKKKNPIRPISLVRKRDNNLYMGKLLIYL